LVEKRDILRTASSFFNSDIFIITFLEKRVSRYAEQIFDKERMGFPTPLSSYITIIPNLERNVKFFYKENIIIATKYTIPNNIIAVPISSSHILIIPHIIKINILTRVIAKDQPIIPSVSVNVPPLLCGVLISLAP